MVAVEDGDRQHVVSDNDSGEGQCSKVDVLLPAGEYEVVVAGDGEGRGLAQYGLALRYAGPCGDGELSIGEECDDGNEVADDGCSMNCQLESACGNGMVDEGEDCDDRNRVSGDGCDGLCSGELFDIVRSEVTEQGALAAGSSDVYRLSTEGVSEVSMQVRDAQGRCTPAVHTDVELTSVMANGVRNRLDIRNGEESECASLLTEIQAGAHELTLRPKVNGQSVPSYAMDLRLTRDVSMGGAFRGRFPAGGDDLYAFSLSGEQMVRLETSDGAGGCNRSARVSCTLPSPPPPPISTQLRAASVFLQRF